MYSLIILEIDTVPETTPSNRSIPTNSESTLSRYISSNTVLFLKSVEYASGNGDYAEWLERLNQNEYLSPGDIVAVKGGKISKTIENFEQLMVVSHKPIVLGNVPQKDRLHLGNNVAFMGQVPVKVMGPVEIGDYIVAHEKIKGYGQAVKPNKMTANQFKKAVGRAWEKNNLKGPKLINTVVGIHNGDWKNLFENLVDKQNKI